MSKLKEDLQRCFQGEPALESAEVVELSTNVSEEPTWSQDDVEDMLEERDAVIEAQDAVDDLQQDTKFLRTAAVVTDVVGQAATAAETMPPAVAESFVSQANCIIADTSKQLGVEIPQLSNDEDGSVSEASMESLLDWFGTATKAFRESSSQFFGRITLTLARLNDSSKGLMNRCSRVRTKINSRKGTGGKDLKINSMIMQRLVLGEQYALNPIAALVEFSNVTLAITKVVEQYHARVDAFVKAKIFDVLANNNRRESLFTSIEVSDLVREMNAILANQPQPLLGNVKYVASTSANDPVSGVAIMYMPPSSAAIVKQLPPPKSLSNEDVLQWIGGLEALIIDQTTALESMTKACNKSFQNVKSTLEKVNHDKFTSPADEQVFDVNVIELLRLQTQVVNEVGGICKRLSGYQADLIERIDAALMVVEESLFQD